MNAKRILLSALAILVLTSVAAAQARPAIVLMTSAGPVFSKADMKAESGFYEAGTPLVVASSQDKKVMVDGTPTLMYQVKDAGGTASWVPGSRLSFSAKGFARSAFSSEDQYLGYLRMAAKPGDRFVAIRTYQKVRKGDMGWLADFSGSSLPVCVVWERNLDATPNEDFLPEGFPEALQPFVYFVNAGDVELALDAKPSGLADLAKSLPKSAAEYDGFYSDETDDLVPWFVQFPESDYGYDDSGYYDYDGYSDYDDSGYYDYGGDYYDASAIPDCEEGQESYGMFKVGSSVILGKHDDINGGDNWTSEMDKYVGKTTTITEFFGADAQGFIVAKVKGNTWQWRIRNMTLKGRGEAGSYGFKVGDKVILGSHRSIDGNRNWASDMCEYVGMEATITGMSGTDSAGCPYVNVDADDGDWVWRVENLKPAK